MGGSPCQGFSFAGKQLAFDDPRSALFFEFHKAISYLQPKYFLLENVRMKKEYLDIISEYMGVEPIFINSSFVSAQSRQRYYWTNIPNVEQPEERGIVLRDILEGQPSENPVKQTERNARHLKQLDDKSLCMTATMYKGAGNNGMTLVPQKIHDIPKDVLKDNERQRRVYSKEGKSPTLLARADSPKVMKSDKPQHIGTAVDVNGHDILKRVYSPDGKSPTVNTCQGGNTEPKVVMGAYRGRYNEDGSTSQKLELRKDNKTNTITTVQKDNVLTKDEVYWRKLTPIECERLQTVPNIEKNITILLCLDQVKNFVNAVDKNPKLLKLVLSAEKSELKEYVDSVVKTINPNHQPTKSIVQQSADIKTQMQTEKCMQTNLKEKNLTADIVANKTINSFREQEECSAILNVFINSIEGKIINFGKAELRQNDKISAIHQSGKRQLNKYGIEIMQLVKDVEQSLLIKKDNNFTSTISNHLSLSNLGQMLTISYFFAKSVIGGHIPKQIQKINLSFQMIDGYTEGVSNTQRYKMLGNGWTIEVIAHILKNMEIDNV
jgi:DNA (cytosine-5)-methyltransferase 3A